MSNKNFIKRIFTHITPVTFRTSENTTGGKASIVKN